MKTPIHLILALLLSFSLSNANAQGIDSLEILPKYPTTDDSVKIISHTVFPTSYCSLDSSSVDLKEGTINIFVWNEGGMLNAVCNSTDTITLGKLNAGEYELHYELIGSYSQRSYDIDTITFTVRDANEPPPLVREDKLWSNTSIGSMPRSIRESYWIKFQEDTLINNTTYKKIWRSDNSNRTNWYTDGFIRQDSAQKVYTWHPEGNEELLLYDYSLEENDTFFHTSTNDYSIVDSVVYAPFGNAEDTVKQIHIGGAIWFEGVGSNLGLFELFSPTDANTDLVCYFDIGGLVYHNQDFWDCFPEPKKLIIPGKSWVFQIASGEPPFEITHDMCYEIGNDTTISGENYKILLSAYNCDQPQQIRGFIRETADGKVYFLNNTVNDEEYLLYDFGMEVGDTVFTENNNVEPYYILDSTDINDKGQKLFYVTSEPGNNEIWIEGVGAEKGLLKEQLTGGAQYFTCCIWEGEIVYHNPDFKTCYSQTVFSKDQVWSTMYGNDDCDNLFCESYYNRLGEDTVINKQIYSKLLLSTDSLMNEWWTYAFIRQKGKKVYFRRKGAQSDCLLYDFGCAVGDTLNLNCWCPQNETKFKVDSIKSLPVMGTERKHVYLSYLHNSSTDVWIENIGSTAGLMNSGGLMNCMTGNNTQLLCCMENGIKIYQDDEYEGCYLDSQIVISIQENKIPDDAILIYPNPATDNITVSSVKSIIRNIELFDLTGNCIFQDCTVENQNYTLSTSGFSPGVYLLKVATDENQVVRKVLFK